MTTAQQASQAIATIQQAAHADHARWCLVNIYGKNADRVAAMRDETAIELYDSVCGNDDADED